MLPHRRPSRAALTGTILLTGLAALLPLATVGPASAATSARPYDVDGDGRRDLVVGAASGSTTSGTRCPGSAACWGPPASPNRAGVA